jgi:hypothetical protein
LAVRKRLETGYLFFYRNDVVGICDDVNDDPDPRETEEEKT